MIDGGADPPPLVGERVSASAVARLDRLPPTRYIWTLVVLVSFGAFFEIYDLSLSAPLGLGLVAAGIFHRGSQGLFGLTDQATFIAATFAGLYVGTLGFSTAADRFGRRPIFTVALLWYAGATVVMGFQNSAIWIDLWRFVASIGVGLELVAIDCYLVELTPSRIRGRAFAVSTSIQFLSVPLVALLAWGLIPGVQFGMPGWRWLAVLPAVGALLVWWVRRALPESPRWLESHGREVEADRVLSNMESRVARDLCGPLPPLEPLPVFAVGAVPLRPSLWRPPYRRRTLVLIVFHTFQTIGYFGFNNWLPTLLVAQGITVSKSLGYAAVLAIIPPVAPLVFTTFADRVERKWLVAAGALLAAGAGLMLARVTQGTPFVLFALVGGAVAAGNSLMSLSYHTYQSELFPTQIRARSVGFVYSFSRLSALFSGYIIALALEVGGTLLVYTIIAGAMVLVALDVGLFGPRTRGKPLELVS